ncbi:bifunctional methylenetetrahydrofolate dehydrogenase/methenyltetrahydrofolate cyclohydrolase FolD [bacterium]|nr:bifunctional methylenetetrahydrofolate dehydrogenase/methenyltetrahydrofolate cyclohydrolase FolD [bacterium]
MTVILDGKGFALKIEEELREKILSLPSKPKLAVVIVGDNPASQIYVKNKQLAAKRVGIDSITIELPKDTSDINLLNQIEILNRDETIDAILVQLPLPDHINKSSVLQAISPIKDVDGFSPYNLGLLFSGSEPVSLPCTPKGIIKLLKHYNIPLEGRNAVVIGRSLIVGKPMALLLQRENATVTLAHSKTQNLRDITKKADIIVCAVGKPHLIDSSYISGNPVIIDVGINRVEGKITGDVDFDGVKDMTSYITPVPKGIGPITIAMLLENTYELYNFHQKIRAQYGDLR